MSKNEKAPAAVVDTAAEVTLEEFCTRLSTKDKRVELIGGFHSDEKRAGHVKDTEEAYAARYDEFINKPA